MTEKPSLLIVDDEIEVLNSLKRLFRREFDITVSNEPLVAAEKIKENKYAVIISDMKMPKMSGAELLTIAYENAPETARILLTGYSDIDSTAMAINQGKVNNYVSKPWQNDDIKNIVLQASEQYQLKQSVVRLEQELKRKNKLLQTHNQQLESKVKERTESLSNFNAKLKLANQKQRHLFQDVIEMINLIIEDTTGSGDGHVKRVANHCKLVARHLKLEKNVITQVYLAGLMHEIGKVALSDQLARSVENDLTRAQLSARQQHAVKGAEILNKVPHLQAIGLAVRHQYERFNGTGEPEHLIGENIPIASRILAVVNDFDKLLLGRVSGEKLSQTQAMQTMKTLGKAHYDPDVIDTYFELLQSKSIREEANIDLCVGVDMLEEGMHLTQDLLNKQGAVILTEGTEITEPLIEKLKCYQRDWNFIFNVFVH